MSAATFTVDYRALAEALAIVKPHVGTDYTLPMLCTVRMQTYRGDLFLAGCDRYSAGIVKVERNTELVDSNGTISTISTISKRISVPFVNGVRLALDLRDLARVLAVFKPMVIRGLDFPLVFTVDGDVAVVENDAPTGKPSTRLVVDVPNYQHPSIGGLFRDLLAKLKDGNAEPVPTSMWSPGKLARFTPLGKFACLTVSHIAPNKPMIVTEAGRFVGLVMPMRAPVGGDYKPATDPFAQWRELFTGADDGVELLGTEASR